VISITPMLSPWQVRGTAAAAPTSPCLAPSRQGHRSPVVQEIIADHDLAVAEGLAAHAGPLGRSRNHRDVDTAQTHGIFAEPDREAKPIGALGAQENRRGQEVATREGGFADLAVQFLRRFRVQDRFVGCAERSERTREIGRQVGAPCGHACQHPGLCGRDG